VPRTGRVRRRGHIARGKGQTKSAQAAAKKAKEIVLRLPLKEGRTELQAWFQDAAGADVCGVYFLYVRRVGDAK
jgi:hypothetical protein